MLHEQYSKIHFTVNKTKWLYYFVFVILCVSYPNSPFCHQNPHTSHRHVDICQCWDYWDPSHVMWHCIWKLYSWYDLPQSGEMFLPHLSDMQNWNILKSTIQYLFVYQQNKYTRIWGPTHCPYPLYTQILSFSLLFLSLVFLWSLSTQLHWAKI